MKRRDYRNGFCVFLRWRTLFFVFGALRKITLLLGTLKVAKQSFLKCRTQDASSSTQEGAKTITPIVSRWSEEWRNRLGIESETV